MLKSIDSFTVDISVIYTEDTTRSRLLFSEMIVSEFSEPISLSAVLIVSECAVGEKKNNIKASKSSLHYLRRNTLEIWAGEK